jgi:hypothetical protein
MATSNHLQAKIAFIREHLSIPVLATRKPTEYTDEEAATLHLRARILGFDQKIHEECNLQIHGITHQTRIFTKDSSSK